MTPMEDEIHNNTAARKPRKTISPELLQIIRTQLSQGMSPNDVASSNFLSYSCVIRIANKITKGLENSQIINRKGRKLNQNVELETQLAAMIQNDNAMTQVGISKSLENSGLSRSQSFISKRFKKMGITRKRLSLVPVERNLPRIIDTRAIYGLEIDSISLDRLVFLDESGFNSHTLEHHGYSYKNTKAYAQVKASKGINQSLMCAIDINGVIASEVMQGAYNGDLFMTFIVSKLLQYFREHPSSILIMDNCKFHHRQDVLRLLSQNRIVYKFLPAYSPQLNPIEEFFGALKANFKSIRPRPTSNLEVKDCVQSLVESQNRSLAPLYNRMKRFLLIAISRQPFI